MSEALKSIVNAIVACVLLVFVNMIQESSSEFAKERFLLAAIFFLLCSILFICLQYLIKRLSSSVRVRRIFYPETSMEGWYFEQFWETTRNGVEIERAGKATTEEPILCYAMVHVKWNYAKKQLKIGRTAFDRHSNILGHFDSVNISSEASNEIYYTYKAHVDGSIADGYAMLVFSNKDGHAYQSGSGHVIENERLLQRLAVRLHQIDDRRIDKLRGLLYGSYDAMGDELVRAYLAEAKNRPNLRISHIDFVAEGLINSLSAAAQRETS